MAFAFPGASAAKEVQERLLSRMAGMRKKVEKGISQTTEIVEVNGSLFGWGYANERWGEAPADDPSGLKEYKLLGVPADLATGTALLGVALFGGLGKYEDHGIHLGAGSTGAFSYRLGGEVGRRAERDDGKKKPAKGPAQVTSGAGPNGGRMHHVEYANA